MLVTALLALLGACSRDNPDVESLLGPGPPVEQRTAARHMVSAAHPLAVEIGLDTLRRGGHAVDAAVAVQMALGFLEAPETGIGGGGFLLLRDASTGELQFFDGRETAPAAATPDRFTLFGRPLPLWATVPSGRAVGVPGLVAMLGEAHAAHGRLPWSELLQPTIALARAGVDMPARLQRQVAEDPSLWLFGDMRRYFVAQARAEPPRLRNPALADTLAALAEQGPAHLYHGDIAEAIVARAAGRWPWPGDLGRDDLADYRAQLRDPICSPYRRWIVCGAPPPSSGGIALAQILGVLEHFPMADYGPDSAIGIHLIAEASRLAFADRERHVGDPDHIDVPVTGLADRDYLRARAALIDPNKAMSRALPGEPGQAAVIREAGHAMQAERGGTSHFSVVDAQGNMVALTSSIEAPFGARMMTDGFLLNNQLTDFSFSAERHRHPHPNAVGPGKRPRSSMSPVIVLERDGTPRLVLGSRGGSRIIGHVARTLIAMLDWDMDIQHAIALPNFVHRGDRLELERGSPIVRHRRALEALGHEVAEVRMTSGLHGIERIAEGWRGGADPRQDGVARGD
ncbi:gamma-glutamyltransferase [Rhodocyclaceae bacterium SMB388]